jgi:uncharacterized protein
MLAVSRYTLHTSEEQHHYFFNTLSGASLMLDDAQHAALRAVLDKAPEEPRSAAEKGIADLMRQSGLLVEAGTDELAAALAQYDDRRHAADTMSVVITPTLSCNMSCFYCYQDRNSTAQLSAGDIDAIVRFVGERLAANGRLDVTWFGGEPLLALPFVGAVSRQLIALAAARGARYGARVISNCYHLDAAAIATLEQCAVDRIQVTFDGPQQTHDRVRRSRDAAAGPRTGSFARIVDNLRRACRHFTIVARVNVTERNVDHMPELIDQLAEAGLHDGLAAIYFAPAYSYTTTTPKVSYAPRPGVHLRMPSFADAEVALLRHAAARGFALRNPLRAGYAGCIAVQENGFVIDASGEIKKCTNDVSRPATALASLRPHDGDFATAYTARYDAFRPEGDAGCRDCQLLPVCYSACPQRNMLSDEDRRDKCPSHKYNWKQTLPMFLNQQR